MSPAAGGRSRRTGRSEVELFDTRLLLSPGPGAQANVKAPSRIVKDQAGKIESRAPMDGTGSTGKG